MWAKLDNKRYILVGLMLSLLLISGYFLRQQAFSLRFVDEEDNFAIGNYLSKGDILYDDIITNHQPLTYIFSLIVHKYYHPSNTYLLVNKHREAMIVWSAAWSLFLVFYFGLGALIAISIYELTKIYLMGNLFLAEAQIVYPLMFLGGLIIFHRKINKFELLFTGFCLGLSIFLLSPTWPAVVFLFFLMLYQHRDNLYHTVKYLLVGILVLLFVILIFVSSSGYIHYALYANLAYTVPNYQSEAWSITILKAFLTPFLVFFFTESSPTARTIQILSILLGVNLLFLLFRRSYFKSFAIFVLLGLSNIRFVYPGQEAYSGFHLLPWYALMILVTSFVSVDIFLKNGNLLLRTTNLLLIMICFGLSINFAKNDLFQKRNRLNDYNINYSTHTNRGEAVKIMKTDGDTLFVSPNAWLVYWQSDTDHLPKLYGYYTWMVGVPEIHAAVLHAFSNIPPTYFYCENCKGLDLEIFLEKYKEIKSHGNSSMLYVLQSKIAKLTNNQLEQLRFYGFSFD